MLLGAEFLLAAFGNVLGRAIDYTDARLADEFTREVSLRVMEYATRLDLACLEDPAFYDKLERARVQATDRRDAQCDGPLAAAVHHAGIAVNWRDCVLAVAIRAAADLRSARLCRREPLCISRIRSRARAHAAAPGTGLFASASK